MVDGRHAGTACIMGLEPGEQPAQFGRALARPARALHRARAQEGDACHQPLQQFGNDRAFATAEHHIVEARRGIQARGGCSCAGPYGLSLLGIDDAEAERLRTLILSGNDEEKPGWVRLNLSYLLDDEEADLIIGAVDALSRQFGRGAEARLSA